MSRSARRIRLSLSRQSISLAFPIRGNTIRRSGVTPSGPRRRVWYLNWEPCFQARALFTRSLYGILVTQTVLGQLNVTNLSSSSFTYAGLDSSTAILLQANHGYVIGVNSTAVGNPVNSSSVGNNVYAPNGLYVDQGAGSDISLLPFTEGTITVERGFIYNYGYEAQPASFYPPALSWQSQDNGFLGICDVGFAR